MLKNLRQFAARWPRAGLRLARSLAFVTHPLRFGVAEDRLAAALGDLARPDVRRARRQTWSTYLQTEALDAGLAQPGERPRHFPAILPARAPATLTPPLILGIFHIGPYFALGPMLGQLPGEVLALHRGPPEHGQYTTLLSTGEGTWDRARAFKRAVAHLKSGAYVFAALDAVADTYDVATVNAPLLGRTITLARGPFALARLVRSPIVPLAARWSGSAIAVSFGDPIPASDDEAQMAAAATRWLEDYLREFPGEAAAGLLDRLRPARP